ncbi:transporter [Mucilaginibacter pankratovii]|uniref:transporter n=1 Tax=Mucilaginibacter pankratovii TaxID=2772110 RepID=UPI001CD107D2|nr:transporter [Mucilaginibacter pankratovii]
MRILLKFAAAIAVFLFLTKTNVNAQGCVAIRSTGGLCNMDEHPDSTNSGGVWLFNSNSRYYRSYKHFVGSEEQKQRIALGTNVINHSYAQDLTLTRIFNNRWSFALDIPMLANSRSSLYEHGGKERRYTHSFGVGDITLKAYAWLLNPAKAKKGNIQAGLGIKLPTGSYTYQDYFYNTGTGGAKTLGPVDQSIQLGDGGTGITTEINTYYNFSHKFGLYGSFYYLISPRELNGVSSARGGTPSAKAVANGSDIMSVPDQLMVRAGANYGAGKFNFSAGIRYECLPVKDLVGGSNGFRRPGYITSIEPGVTYRISKFSIYTFVPVAIVRNRTQSVPDKISTQLTGVNSHGDAAFADYAVNLGVSFKL